MGVWVNYMAHKTKIDGTSYDISGGKCNIDGVKYNINKGKTLIDGTGYDINFLGPTKITVKGDGTSWSGPSGVKETYSQIIINNTLNINSARIEEFNSGENVEIELIVSEFGLSAGRAYIEINGEEAARTSSDNKAVSYKINATGKNIEITLSVGSNIFNNWGVITVNY